MSKCSMCHKWGLSDYMFKSIDPKDPTIRVCLSCKTLIKKYGRARAMEIISLNKRHDHKRKRWNNEKRNKN